MFEGGGEFGQYTIDSKLSICYQANYFKDMAFQ